MSDFLLPSTDAGVFAQLLVVLVVSGVALFAVRKNPPVRVLVVGIGLLVVALMGVRAIH